MIISINQQGFSLLELMLVVVILSILSAIAYPTYQNYLYRARFAEVIIATEPFKLAIALALQEGVPLYDLKNGNHGIPLSPDPTPNLNTIKVKNGTITAYASTTAGGATYILKPNQDGSHWTISGSCLEQGLCHA